MQDATCGPIGWECSGAFPKHSLMALDDTTKLSRLATDADTKADLLGHLTESSEFLDGDTQINGVGRYSDTSHQTLTKEGTLTGIASGAIAKGDLIGVGATDGQLEAGGALAMGIAMHDAAVGEYVAYLPTI